MSTTDKTLTRYTFSVRDTDYAEDDPRHWKTAGAPRRYATDAQAEAHVRGMALGEPVWVSRNGSEWSVYSYSQRRR